MTTLTLTIDNRLAAILQRLAARRQQDATLVAIEVLSRALPREEASDAATTDDADDGDTVSLAHSQQQIRQIFERNEW